MATAITQRHVRIVAASAHGWYKCAMNLSPATCRAARGLLNISQERLAALSGVSQRAITNYEAENTRLMAANREAIQRALDVAGVEFLDGGGVRLRQ